MPTTQSIPHLFLTIFIWVTILLLLFTLGIAFIPNEQFTSELTARWQFILLPTNIAMIVILLNFHFNPNQSPSKSNLILLTLWAFLTVCILLNILVKQESYARFRDLFTSLYTTFHFAIIYILISRLLLYRNLLTFPPRSRFIHLSYISSVAAVALSIFVAKEKLRDAKKLFKVIWESDFALAYSTTDLYFNNLLFMHLIILAVIIITPFFLRQFPNHTRWFAGTLMCFFTIQLTYEWWLFYSLISGFTRGDQDAQLTLFYIFFTRFLFSLTLIIYAIHLFRFRPPYRTEQ